MDRNAKLRSMRSTTTRHHIGTSLHTNTVNSEIFARILFSRIALKGIFVTLGIRDLGMVYIYQ